MNQSNLTNTLVYYENHNGQYVTYDLDTCEVIISNDLNRHKNRFKLTKKFEATENGLIEFADRLLNDRNEIIKTVDIFNSKFRSKKTGKVEHFYKTSNNIVLNFFKRNSYYTYYNNEFEPITLEECRLSDACYNAGIYYAKKGMFNDCHSYDFRMFYPSILADKNFYFPTTAGSWIDFDEIEDFMIGEFCLFK